MILLLLTVVPVAAFSPWACAAAQNVIRYFFLRALQLPPEAWLRFGGFNGGITILEVRPVTGRVGVDCFGDFGHMSLEQTTFGRHRGLEK